MGIHYIMEVKMDKFKKARVREYKMPLLDSEGQPYPTKEDEARMYANELPRKKNRERGGKDV